jgi:HEAT repeat protein
LIGVVASLASRDGGAEPSTPDRIYTGRSRDYANLSPASLEAVTTSQHIKTVTAGNVAPTEIWRALEHGEKVECLDCIPHVAKLLYDAHPKTREIGAWWLRRRIFGVFGPGEVYAQVVDTLQNDESELRRAYAAEAVGEFLSFAGVKHVAAALRSDVSPRVRKSAVLALLRLNHQGPQGELRGVLANAAEDEEVVMAALHAVTRINVFTGIDAVVSRIGSPSVRVRKRAAEALGRMRAGDAVIGLIALTSPDTEPDAAVREAAVAALGRIADPAARDAVSKALRDPNGFVRDAANVALRRL